ncbi:MAG: hypothetical protein Q4F54_03090 [Coriobacteriia bacterium]|nr:hypothetical protein [Coriobacteriia bacterium]
MKIKGIHKRILICVGVVVMATAFIFGLSACQQKQQAPVKTAVPFSQVNVDDGFMRDYIKLVICNVIPTAIANVEKAEGGIPNIKNCAL